ncbi:LysM peptidoglycan-binding domain-containing protein [Paenibacillus wynnii]|uniref:LysM peptidoglycan-binding domain-containing protein n=1 Tax=Paenibacillus wynnii TaxID=268407 RepID=UPI0027907715|nr:LysM domain-containing protein [Paenibacillus wynnii]MDQ0196789.1 morphogenetic protein associated with SpoVID [Paenibacillus wynnii]
MKIHIVKQGDTLYALSQKYGVPLQKIIESNPQISNPDVLEVGGKVKIPSIPVTLPDNNDVYYKHTVKQGDTLWKLSKAWGIPLQEMISANPQLKNPNALLVGEVVNIPKKGMAPLQSTQPMHMPTHMTDKTQPGGKTFTGPIEQPPVVEIPNEAPVQVMPIEMPPVQVMPAEVAPVQEKMMHSESQSLFVQISVPTQEVVSYYEMPPVPENQPIPMVLPTQTTKSAPIHHMAPANMAAPINQIAPMAQHMPCNCDKSAGYPGLTENPNFFDCPPAYPLYEPMPNMAMYAPMNQIQPLPYEPECMPPYFYPNHMYSPADISGPCYPNAMPNYMEASVGGVNPNNNYPIYAAPQYVDPYQNMPWPTSCGCGMGEHVQSLQANPYEMPMNNSFPTYTNQPSYSPYDSVMPHMIPQSGMPVSPQNMYGNSMVSSIPPIPEYPGLGNESYGYHNRITEFQQQANIIRDDFQITDDVPTAQGTEESLARSEEIKSESSPKVKTSSRSAKPVKTETSKAQRSSKNKGTAPIKKRRNPWISN